jgi:uncharacterized membrane protein YhaH (DUF805 family)
MDSLISSTILAQNSGGGGGAIAGCMVGIIYLAILVAVIAGMWKMFVKAGQPGWACIVPIYNAYIMLKIVGRPGWWLILLFIPFVSIVVGIIVAVDIAKAFGKGIGFAIGIILLGFIFIPILGFGDAEYQGPVAG